MNNQLRHTYENRTVYKRLRWIKSSGMISAWATHVSSHLCTHTTLLLCTVLCTHTSILLCILLCTRTQAYFIAHPFARAHKHTSMHTPLHAHTSILQCTPLCMRTQAYFNAHPFAHITTRQATPIRTRTR
jgi:hypothetical protein